MPILAPALVGVALFGFTLSLDELARTSQAIGGLNTLPLELQGLTTTVTTPEIYALGTVTTARLGAGDRHGARPDPVAAEAPGKAGAGGIAP